MKKPLVLCLALAGCDLLAMDDWQPQTLENEGALCLVTNMDDPGGVQTFSASTPITIVYDANTCLSSSCDRNDEASVEASVSDGGGVNTITLTSSASWEANMGRNISCTDDCGFLGAEESLGALAEGAYTVTWGEQSFNLTIPGEQEACFGELFY